MAIRNFGSKQSNAINYQVRRLATGKSIFATDCEPTDPAAIQMTRAKNSTTGKFMKGDSFYVKGDNAIQGTINFAAVQEGFEAPAKNLTIGLKSVDESGKKVTEFLKLSLVSSTGRINDATARLLVALQKADLGEEILVAIHTFEHKAGDDMGDDSGRKWEKDGDRTIISAYQEHLKSADNVHGIIAVPRDAVFKQPRFAFSGGKTTALAEGEAVPAGAQVLYDHEAAAKYAAGVANDLMGRIRPSDAPASQPPASNEEHGDDMSFGDDAPVTGMRQR